MMTVTILHEAEVELWEAVAYYEGKAGGLGLDFQTEIDRSITTISELPESCHFAGMEPGDSLLTVSRISSFTRMRTIKSGYSRSPIPNGVLNIGGIERSGGGKP